MFENKWKNVSQGWNNHCHGFELNLNFCVMEKSNDLYFISFGGMVFMSGSVHMSYYIKFIQIRNKKIVILGKTWKQNRKLVKYAFLKRIFLSIWFNSLLLLNDVFLRAALE